MDWQGVWPALTTAFDVHFDPDYNFVADHCRRVIEAGCTGVVALGSLGEAATLSFEEKKRILQTCRRALDSRAPLVAGISALGTREAVALAKVAEAEGCDGLMILPPYVYPGDWRELKAHMSAVLRATPLPSMLYNNPVAYGADFLPAHIVELAEEHANLQAVKESSTDARRVTAIRALCGDRLAIFVGVDDVVLEGVAMGAVGWISGLADAMPEEAVALLNAGRQGQWERAWELYRWLLPLLRMDTLPKFVQLIKLIQEEAGMGSSRVRPPRLSLVGEELDAARRTIRQALKQRDTVMAAQRMARA